MKFIKRITKISFEYNSLAGYPVTVELNPGDTGQWSFSTGNEKASLSSADIANIYNIMQIVEKING